jgi:sterol desaturase/sphingolipid hydroxylase (fatty acid hydroxylase superfamily)
MAITLKTIWSVVRSEVVINRTRLILFTVTPALLPLGAIAFMQWIPMPLAKYFFFTKGWVAWTLTEYCLHRWGYHKTRGRQCHAGESAIKNRNQFVGMSSLSVVPMGAGLWTLWSAPVWVTYFSGWMCGLSLYWMMHQVLHRPMGAKLFTGMVRRHIWHHCANPDLCFGISTTLWDRIFKTLPAKSSDISSAMIGRYYSSLSTSDAGFTKLSQQIMRQQRHN